MGASHSGSTIDVVSDLGCVDPYLGLPMRAPDPTMRIMRRSLLLLCPLLACSDDITELQPGTTSSSEDTMGTVDPPTVTAGDTDLSATSLDGTGPSNETSDSSDATGSSSGETGSSASDGSASDGSASDGSSSGGSSSDGSSSSGSSSGGPGCGDGLLDASEQCDGADLAGYDCVTLDPGFTGGTLACANDCSFDTSGCEICGNGVIDGAEVCDGEDLGDLGCWDVGGGLTGGVLACDAACGHDTSACTNVPWPLVGEVVITEIMLGGGTWFEVYNPSPGTSFQLEGCTIEGGDVNGNYDGFTIDVDMVIGPGEYRLFVEDSPYDRGFLADYQWQPADFDIASYESDMSLHCDGVQVDGKFWSNKEDDSFPLSYSHSASLDPDSYDAVANNSDANWCAATTVYWGGYTILGTPRYSNPQCGVGPVDYPIDSCRLQLPDVIVQDQGTDVTVYGRLHIAGLTDLTGVDDPAVQVLGDVGYGPAGTDPAVDATWTWQGAVPHPSYDSGSPGYEADHDEYWATLELPVGGTYDYAFRFTGDGGTTFTYCDGQPAGSTDGYQPANAGHMTSNTVVPPVLWFSEYVEGTGNNEAIEIYNPAAEAVDIGACELHRYSNGSSMTYNDIELAGSIAAGDVLVVCGQYISNNLFCDVLSPFVSFNGDDAFELECAGITLDVIGQIGFDPGSEWQVGGVGTQDETLRRSCSVTAGDANGADVFDPSLEWATFPVDAFDDLGQHVCP